MNHLCYIKLSKNLYHLELEKQLADTINEKIKALPNYLDLKLHPQVILLCCMYIENCDFKKKSKIKLDKKSLAMRILQSIYTYSEPEKKQIDTIIEHLHTNNDIKKISYAKKCSILAYEWIKKKLL